MVKKGKLQVILTFSDIIGDQTRNEFSIWMGEAFYSDVGTIEETGFDVSGTVSTVGRSIRSIISGIENATQSGGGRNNTL